MRNTIRIPVISREIKLREKAYKLSDGRFKKFGKWLIGKLLKYKIMEHDTEELKSVDFKNIEIDFDEAMKCVIETMNQVNRHYEPKDIEMIIMGAEQEREIMRGDYLMSAVSFAFPDCQYYKAERDSKGNMRRRKETLLGVELRIVPWFDGVLIVPKP